MDHFSIVIIILLIILLILSQLITKNSHNNTKEITIKDSTILPYKAKYLLTKTEYSFYKFLKPICDKHNSLICPKVGLKDIAEVTDKSNYYKWFGKINQKHVDFLICDNNLKPTFAIELDDYSHGSQRAKKSDDFKNALFLKISLPLKRIKVSNTYDNLEDILFPSTIIFPGVNYPIAEE